MADHDVDLFVIGAGSGGVRAARIASSYGARVMVAEEFRVGGTCVIRGCVPKKLLVYASRFSAEFEDAAGYGWAVPEPVFHWPTLIANKDREIARLEAAYIATLERNKVKWVRARAVLEDAHTVRLSTGAQVRAETILIATGGWPHMGPNIPGVEHAISSNEAFHLTDFPSRIVIQGGGYIAVEFACIFAGLGVHVDMVIRQQFPLRGFDEDIREALAEALAADGITIHRGTTVASVEANGAARRVHLVNGTMIETGLVFSALGRQAYTQGLGLEAAGVDTDGFGAIEVDGENRTSQANIYAIGDVTDRLNLTPVAIAEGHSLADRLFGPGPRRWDLDRVATAVFSTPPIGTVGLTEAEAARQGPVDVYVSRFTPMRHTLSGRARKTLMKLVVDQASQRVVGAHMLGEDAAEILQGLSIAINAGATKADFDRTVGIHPTAAEEFVTMRTRTRVAGVPEVKAAE